MYINVKEHKSKLLISELNEDYKLTFKVDDSFKPELYVESSNQSSEYRSLIDNRPLEKIQFSSISEFKDYKYKQKDYENSILYGDIPPEYQYIRAKYSHNDKTYEPRYWFIDIETGVPDIGFPDPVNVPSPINLIQIAESDNDTRYVFGRLNIYNIKENEEFFYCDSEEKLLTSFKDFMFKRTPSVVTAWNGDGFDFPYIINRTIKLGLEPEMYSPFGVLEDHTAEVFGKKIKIQKPVGIAWLDYIPVFKKADPSGKESWALDYVSTAVLGPDIGGKLDYKKHGYRDMRAFINNDYDPSLDTVENSIIKRAYSMKDKYPEVFQRAWYNTFVEYGIVDVDVLKAMDLKKGVLNAIVDLSQTMSSNIYDSFATVKPWQIHIYNELYPRKQFVPSKTPFDTYKIPGGHVFAKPGLYKWVCSFDVRSLYPFCMISLNMSPETYVHPRDVPKDLAELTKSFTRYITKDEDDIQCEDIYIGLSEEQKQKITELLQKYNLCMSANGAFFRKDKYGIIAELIQGIYDARNYNKKKMKETEKIVEQLKKELIKRGINI